jgi:serine protease Do
MQNLSTRLTTAALALALAASPLARAAGTAELVERVSPSLVGVKFTWDREDGKREFVVLGTVVSSDGLILVPGPVFSTAIPDAQLADFKILIPRADGEPTEIEAKFAGRDERYDTAFVQATGKLPEGKTWQHLTFEPAEIKLGQKITSVGRLTKNAGYNPYAVPGEVSVVLRGEQPTAIVMGGLAIVGAPVFDEQGKAIGYVNAQEGQLFNLDERERAMQVLMLPPKFFLPATDFAESLKSPPSADKPIVIGWTGLAQLSGVRKDVAEVYNLGDTPALEIGDVVPDTAGAKAGLAARQLIVAVNGKQLDRGDEVTELPDIFRRTIKRLPVGSDVTLTIIRDRNSKPEDVTFKLEEQPPRANTAARHYFEDLGFSVRSLVFGDKYSRKLEQSATGVVIAFVRQQSAAASGSLRPNDMVTELNGKPVATLDEFKAAYEQFRKDSPDQAVVLAILREGRTDTIRIEPPK